MHWSMIFIWECLVNVLIQKCAVQNGDQNKNGGTHTGKHRALSREVTCNFRLYFKIGRTSVKPR